MIGQAGAHPTRAAIASSSWRRNARGGRSQDDAPPCASRALPDQRLRAGIHGVANLEAKAAQGQRRRMAPKELTVEPGGTAGLDLRLDAVGTTRRRAAGELHFERRSSTIRPAYVARRIEVGEAHMVSTLICGVDHSVGCARELVVEPAPDKPADYRLPGTLLSNRMLALRSMRWWPVPVDALDDVGASA